MLKNKIKSIGNGIKKFVNDTVQVCKDILSNAQNRLILGLIIAGLGVGVGGGLIASAYIRVSE